MDEESVDEELMLAYRAGDTTGFEILYQRYKGSLYRYLLRQCGQQSQAEKLYEDVWLRVIRAHKRYQPQALFKAYLYHLAHNVLIGHYRHRKVGPPLSYDTDPADIIETHPVELAHTFDAPMTSQQQIENLLTLIAELPEAQREAFLLHQEVGLSTTEIARVVVVTSEAAKNRLRYAMQWLRRGMRSHGG